MKFLALILSFLVISLSVLPCADEILAGGLEKSMPEVANQHDQQDDCADEDACSPFCHCTCCASFSIHPVVITTSSLTMDLTRPYSSYLPGILINYATPVWHPPKIG